MEVLFRRNGQKETYAAPTDVVRRMVLLYVCFMLLKLACDWGYWKLLVWDTDTYSKDFSALKYVNGLLWCTLLFLFIRHDQRRASTFMLMLVLVMQIVPITTVYALGNDSAEYYNLLCLAFFGAELFTGWVENKPGVNRDAGLSRLMIMCFAAMFLFLAAVLIWKNGKPSLTALNIFSVYELREAGSFQNGGKYMGYILTWCMGAVVPFLLAKAMQEKRYIAALLLCGITFLIYLYSGHKTYLFFIPVGVLCALWVRRENSYTEIFAFGCLGFVLLVLLACFAPVARGLFEKAYSLLGRRTMIVPANLKFKYFDYFTRFPKVGWSGVFPRWLLNVHTIYDELDIPVQISTYYFKNWNMWSNTGFLAEGYMRFGHIGTFLNLGIFSLLLRLMDRMQQRAGYAFTTVAFVYPVLSLSDTQLMSSMVFGAWMIILILLLFYTRHDRSPGLALAPDTAAQGVGAERAL